MMKIKFYNYTMPADAVAKNLLDMGFKASEKQEIKEMYKMTDEEVNAVVEEMKIR